MRFRSWLVMLASATAACSGGTSGNPNMNRVQGACPPTCGPTGAGGTPAQAGAAVSGAPSATSPSGALPIAGSAARTATTPAQSPTAAISGNPGSATPPPNTGASGMKAPPPPSTPASSGAPSMGSVAGGPGPGMPPPGGPITDYGAPGPFQTMTMDGSGPDGMYTMIRPTNVGDNGFKHPIATWGNGITTTPSLYPVLLSTIASHGFVIIASDSSNVTADMMTQGLDWLIKQNDTGGMFAGKLDVTRAVAIGYSLGGGGAVTAGSHPAVIATVSFHGLPGAAGNLHGPLLLFTTTADGFVTKDNYVKPCYDSSTKVPTIMATLTIPGYDGGATGKTASNADFNGHLYPLNDAGDERAPAIAWLRLWVYGDQGGMKYFYGSDCTLCKTPWIDIQRKNAMW